MRIQESCQCLYCGNIYTLYLDVAGDYDPPDILRTSINCIVCRSTPYKKLEDEVRQLKKKLRSKK